MASIVAQENEDGTLVLTISARGREAKLLSKYGSRFRLAPNRVVVDEARMPLISRRKTTIRLEMPTVKE